jgi:hypothetical protein
MNPAAFRFADRGSRSGMKKGGGPFEPPAWGKFKSRLSVWGAPRRTLAPTSLCRAQFSASSL